MLLEEPAVPDHNLILTVTPVVNVCLEVAGRKEAFPQMPKDTSGILQKLRTFMGENDIFPLINGGLGGPDVLDFYYSAQDAERIETWLKEQGVTRSK